MGARDVGADDGNRYAPGRDGVTRERRGSGARIVALGHRRQVASRHGWLHELSPAQRLRFDASMGIDDDRPHLILTIEWVNAQNDARAPGADGRSAGCSFGRRPASSRRRGSSPAGLLRSGFASLDSLPQRRAGKSFGKTVQSTRGGATRDMSAELTLTRQLEHKPPCLHVFSPPTRRSDRGA